MSVDYSESSTNPGEYFIVNNPGQPQYNPNEAYIDWQFRPEILPDKSLPESTTLWKIVKPAPTTLSKLIPKGHSFLDYVCVPETLIEKTQGNKIILKGAFRSLENGNTVLLTAKNYKTAGVVTIPSNALGWWVTCVPMQAPGVFWNNLRLN